MNSTDEQIENFKQEKYLLAVNFIHITKQTTGIFSKTSSEITELMDLLQHTHDYSEYFTSFQ